MTSPIPIFQRNYLQGKPFVKVKIAIFNPLTNQSAAFEEKCWVDTGFSGGVHVPDFRRSEAGMAGVSPSSTSLTLAGGQHAPGHVCLAYIQQIENLTIPPPGIETELIMQGHLDHGLLGLEVLRRWIAKFNGPSQELSFY